MGIRYLNNFIKNTCKKSIDLISISELSGKKIVIDINIYIYKFVFENKLIENIYLMLSIFKYYNVIPVFIFDGKPPPEKMDLLIKRKKDKQEAKKEYELLKDKLGKSSNLEEKQELSCAMDLLKKQFVYINKEQIGKAKELISMYGATYYDAPGEADELCAFLVIQQKAWACLSEDMDMFVYGCPRVLRYFSLLNHTLVLYDVNKILAELNMNVNCFREVCVLSGTDYNLYSDDIINIDTSIKLYKQYIQINPINIHFYDWLNTNNRYNININYIKKICEMFDLSKNVRNELMLFKNIKIINSTKRCDELNQILKNDGFIFPL
jgi:flap endonuclease-1